MGVKKKFDPPKKMSWAGIEDKIGATALNMSDKQ